MKIEDIEASMLRHLYEKLTLVYGVSVIETITEQDPTDLTEWVVLDSLTNNLGPQPVQHWFVHIAVQKEAPNAKQKLNVLTDRVKDTLDLGTPIDIYDYPTSDVIGAMCVSDSSLSQVLVRGSGGLMRTLAVSVTY